MEIEVIDAQVHLNRLGADPAAAVANGQVAMNAAGVDAVLIAESDRWDEQHGARPGVRLANGAVRSTYPTSEEAVRTDPKKFAFIGHVDRRDPEIADVIAEIKARTGQLAIRLIPREQTG